MLKPKRKITELNGYYATGDFECFCFDKHNGPEAHSTMVHKFTIYTTNHGETIYERN